MIVLKFGGTSVGKAENIKKVAAILQDYKNDGKRVGVVVSAMSQVTNRLIDMGNKAASGDASYIDVLKSVEETHFTAIGELFSVNNQSQIIAHIKGLLNELEDILRGVYLLGEISLRSLDVLQSFGERMSSYLISQYLKQEGIESAQLDARTVVKTDSDFGSAKVDFEKTNANIVRYFEENSHLPIITGFIGSNDEGQTTTLGRGGSDYSAAIFGAALDAEQIEIWTDVDGVMTADPRVVSEAFTLDQISYEEAMEMSHFGAKVIYPPTLQPAFRKKIPLYIKNTFNPSFIGTLITEESGHSELPVKGVSCIKEVALLTLKGGGMVGVSGVSSRLFGTLAQEGISVILITQASSEHSITFAIAPYDAEKAANAINEAFSIEIATGKLDTIVVEHNLSVVAIIGERMKHTPGIAAGMFSALGKNGINVSAIAQGSSELNVSVVIKNKDVTKAVSALHETFFLSGCVEVNVFMLGWGLIGGTLLKQMHAQAAYLEKEQNLKINVVGLANTKKMVFDTEGVDLGLSKQELLEGGEESSVEAFVEKVKGLNLANSIFVDCTPGHDAVNYYEDILDNSISICTPNKIANSSSLENYLSIQKIAASRKVKFLYETNVGAGLPVIAPLNALKNSGDKVLTIEGVLSGTLSYIFNSYKVGTSFASIVKEAKEKGYTEPDPRDDLNGMDVARKILILAREAGYMLEPEDVEVENILPEACVKAETVEEFLDELAKNDAHFEKKLVEAVDEGKTLRFVASLDNGKASVSLKGVDEQHPFYHLSGSDNMVVFKTKRYYNEPLVIKGPGAGAEVTAAGVFADIITIGNYLTHA